MTSLPDFFRRNAFFDTSDQPFRELNRLQRQMDRLFDGFGITGEQMGRPLGLVSGAWIPSCDIEELDTHYLLSFDLPGVKKDNVKIDIQGNLLTIRGERSEEQKKDKGTRHQVERFQGAFERSFTLPAGIRPEQVQANYQDGVLMVSIPKAEASKPHQVAISEGPSKLLDKRISQEHGAAKAG